MITLYGIPNCDKVRLARRWLDEHAIDYRFHDFRKDGISEALLRTWLGTLDRDTLLNRRGTTWRQLDEAERRRGDDDDGAVTLMLARPAMIRRPVLDVEGRLICGFDPQVYETLL